ncbi:hypothetical protein [Sodalis sp.]
MCYPSIDVADIEGKNLWRLVSDISGVEGKITSAAAANTAKSPAIAHA